MSFELSGGNILSVETAVDVQVDYGDNILDNAPEPTLVGKVLAGWTYDAEGLIAVGASDIVEYHDLTVYALWEDEPTTEE